MPRPRFAAASPSATTFPRPGFLVTHLVRLGKMDDAKRATAEAERKIDSNPPGTAAGKAALIVTIAGCHEMIGDLKTAKAPTGPRFKPRRANETPTAT